MTTHCETGGCDDGDCEKCTKNTPGIEIEKMLFGDFRVQVWDENFNSLLDREYFVRGFESAVLTAENIQFDLFPKLPIYYRELGKELLKIIEGDVE